MAIKTNGFVKGWLPEELKKVLQSVAANWGDVMDDMETLQTLRASDLQDPEISALIAAKMREFHKLEIPGPKNVLLWERMRNWLSQANRLCSPQDAKEFGLDTLAEEIRMLEKQLSRDCQNVGFCHNDLQYGNIMMDEESRSITIIQITIQRHLMF